MTSDRVRVAFIAGTSYCGSTMLSILLNGHPDIFSPGELGPTAETQSADYPCSCGAPLTECPVHVRIAAAMRERGYTFDPLVWDLRFRYSRRRLFDYLAHDVLFFPWLEAARDAIFQAIPRLRARRVELIDRNVAFYRTALETTKRVVFADATKSPHRIADLACLPQLDFRVIHLVRDPRAVAASFVKNDGISLRQGALRWRLINSAIEQQCGRHGVSSYLRVPYEDLCASPQEQLGRIAAFLGCHPCEFPERLDVIEHHVVGNAMRTMVQTVNRVSARSDWQKRLSKAEAQRVLRIAGRVGSRLGYGMS